MSITGGDPQEVSGTADGWVAEESPDQSVDLLFREPDSVSRPSCEERLRAEAKRPTCFRSRSQDRNFVVAEAGIWYLTPSPSLREGSLLRFYDFASKTTRTVYRTERPVGPGLTLAAEGRRILFTQRDRRGSDLMLVENFR